MRWFCNTRATLKSLGFANCFCHIDDFCGKNRHDRKNLQADPCHQSEKFA
jgi:hypothetical protein